jgi:hypothetical protein
MKRVWMLLVAMALGFGVVWASIPTSDLGDVAMKSLTQPKADITRGWRGGSVLDSVGQDMRTIAVPVPSPFGVGVSIAADCRGMLYYTNYLAPVLYKMNSFGVLVDSVMLLTAAGGPVNIDEMSWDEGRQMLWGGEDATFNIFLIDPTTGLCTFEFLGQVGQFPITDGLAFDPTDGTIWHSPDVSSFISHFSAAGVLLGTLIPLDALGNADGAISGICVGTNNRMYVGHDGFGRISIVDKTTGLWISDFATPGGRDEGLECDAINFAPNLVIWSKDAYNNTVTAIQVENGTCVCAALPDTCLFTSELVDMGDLPPCDYPTLVNNPGHMLTGIAWLGDCVTGDPAPHEPDLDACDDGVDFHIMPWTPCVVETVTVFVTAGPNYDRFQGCGGHLYLSAWKDGNLNGNFCDDLPCVGALASEWIIQDQLVAPGAWTFTFIDPGVSNLGQYTGIFRFRLTSQPVGRFGFGLFDPNACPNMFCGTFGLDFLGEVEDYMIGEAQLSVELQNFEVVPGDGAVTLRWITASETHNDHFEIVRDGVTIRRVATQGNGAAQHTYTFTDNGLVNGTTYTYELAAIDENGGRQSLRTLSAAPNRGAAEVTEYALYQNFPNPFNPGTEIAFDLLEGGTVNLKVYNLLGQEVATLLNGDLAAGHHITNFTANDLPSGVYLYRIIANGFVAEKKMLLMK